MLRSTTAILITAAGLAGFLRAESPAADGESPAAAEKPAVERIDAENYRIGDVTFNSKTRVIRFPAEINMDEGLLEFALVRTHGKTHESLLSTDTNAEAINLAFKLLRYPGSRELYYLPNEKGGLSNIHPEVPEDVKTAARVKLEIEWEADGKKKTVPFTDWIQHTRTGKAMPATLWVYSGSETDEIGFMAEITGDLVATWITNAALINFPGEDNEDDTSWIVYPKRVPAVGTKVTVVISPNPDLKKPESTPTTADSPATTK